MAKLAHLKANGPTPESFTFRAPFPAPDSEPGGGSAVDAEFCDWGS